MPKRIFLLVGSPAVGKTTTAIQLAERFDRAVHIRVDGLRGMVVSGYAYPDEAWSPEAALQVRLAREAAMAMAVTYAEAGFIVVIDDFWDPLELAEYQPLLARPDSLGVLIHPEEVEAQRRLIERRGADEEYIRWAIGHVYRLIDAAGALQRLPDAGWLVLDTTSLDPASSVAAILAFDAAASAS